MYVPDLVPKDLPSPNAMGKKAEIEALFGEEDEEMAAALDDNIFADLDAIEDNEEIVEDLSLPPNAIGLGSIPKADGLMEEDDFEGDFVVDDDGAGYKEDIHTDEGLRKQRERIANEHRDGRDGNQNQTDLVDSDLYYVPPAGAIAPVQPLQEAFQSGASPARGNRLYMCFNLIGTICQITSANESTWISDVTFHDSSMRPFHFTTNEQWNVAVLGRSGAGFGKIGSTLEGGTVFYRPFDNWMGRGEWEIELPPGEGVLCLALSDTIFGFLVFNP